MPYLQAPDDDQKTSFFRKLVEKISGGGNAENNESDKRTIEDLHYEREFTEQIQSTDKEEEITVTEDSKISASEELQVELEEEIISPVDDVSLIQNSEDALEEAENKSEKPEPSPEDKPPEEEVSAKIDRVALQGRDFGEQLDIEAEVEKAVAKTDTQQDANTASDKALEKHDESGRNEMAQILLQSGILLNDDMEVKEVRADMNIHPDNSTHAEGHEKPVGPSAATINSMLRDKKNN